MSYYSGLELDRKPKYKGYMKDYSIDPHMDVVAATKKLRPNQMAELSRIAERQSYCNTIKMRYALGVIAVAWLGACTLGASLLIGYVAALAVGVVFWKSTVVSI